MSEPRFTKLTQHRDDIESPALWVGCATAGVGAFCRSYPALRDWPHSIEALLACAVRNLHHAHTCLKDGHHTADRADVLGRVTVKGHQIGSLAGLDDANLIRHANRLG